MTDLEMLKFWLRQFSVKTGAEFTLASGKISNVYVDVKKTALQRHCHRTLANLLWSKISETFGRQHSIDAVAGVALGGCHLASIVAMQASCELDVIYVRNAPKDHGTKNIIESPHDKACHNVVLIEDVVTTGGSSSAAAELLGQAGYNIIGIIAVVDRREEKTDLLQGKWSFVALIDFEELVNE